MDPSLPDIKFIMYFQTFSLLDEKFIDSVGFDVFETEPLPINSGLRKFNQNIYGSHNGSNTQEAVDKTSKIAINKIINFSNI